MHLCVGGVSISFVDALSLLLYGQDSARAKYMARDRFRRHRRTQIPRLDPSLASEEVASQYQERASQELEFNMRIVDFGQHAAQTTGACFWLCLAAGLSSVACVDESSQSVTTIPATMDDMVRQVRAMDVMSLHRARPMEVANTALGQFAAALRHHFCNEESGILLQGSTMTRIFPAFASLASGDGTRSVQHYRDWVRRLATREYADELVLVSVATTLKIRIVVIPWTLPTAMSQWIVASYPASAAELPLSLIHI